MNEIIKGLSKNLLEENPEIEARIKHGIELHRKGTAKFTLLGKDGTEIRNAEIELKRFFAESDYCDYTSPLDPFKYAPDEV